MAGKIIGIFIEHVLIPATVLCEFDIVSQLTLKQRLFWVT